MQKSELILVADKKKLLELAKDSKMKIDKQLLAEILIAIALFAAKSYPLTAIVSTAIGSTSIASRFFRKMNEKDKVVSDKHEFIKEKILKKIQEELSLSFEIYCIDPSEANSIKFDIGDKPTNGSFYIKHPLLDDVYIRPCDYEKTLAREKEAAFRKLASSLGAKKITLKDAKFYDQKGNLSADTKLPHAVCSNVGISAQFNKSGELIREVYSEFGNPRKEPYIPEDLKKWTEIDSDLRIMAHDRLEGHLLKHQVTLKFKEAFTGGGRIAAEIAMKGLDIGGSITKNMNSTWFFEVEYYPIQEKA